METVKLFSFALATLVLGACTSENVIDNGGEGTVLPGEKGYISLSINLPTTPSTRTNDTFGDGQPIEYAVKNATLLIFAGADESSATFAGGYDLGTIMPPDNVGGNVTSTFTVTKEITKPGNGDLYALVVVNRGNILTTEDEGQSWKLNGQALTTNTMKLSNFTTTPQEISADQLYDTNANGRGFFMTNAPLYSARGGDTQPTGGNLSTLTLINAENVYSTASEAEANPAASVYVERAVAKVSLTGSTTGDITTTPSGLTTTGFTLSGWSFDVTNKKTFIVRNMTGSNNWWGYNVSGDYRFVGSKTVGSSLYRTYWGVDPNYIDNSASSYISTDFNKITGTTPDPSTMTGMSNAGYCLENTFNVDNQNQNQTTRVIVAATLNGGTTFYILDNDKGTVYNEVAAKNAIKSEYLDNQSVVSALDESLTATGSIGEDNLEITFDKDAGDLTVTEIKIKDDAKDNFKESTIPAALTPGTDANDAILEAVNAGKKVSCYKGGVAYYPVMIKHFGDEQTPWNNEEYNSNENDFLGRYGVLRNNWYEINVKGIRDIGYADVPDVYGTPDDPIDSYISVEINVLSWAKRTQEVNL